MRDIIAREWDQTLDPIPRSPFLSRLVGIVPLFIFILTDPPLGARLQMIELERRDRRMDEVLLNRVFDARVRRAKSRSSAHSAGK